MRLSEAILRGCQGTEQYFGDYFAMKLSVDGFLENDYTKCCALGAAALSTVSDSYNLFNKIKEIYKKTFLIVKKHPITEANTPLYIIIVSLNDDHKWTREEIAKWLEGQGL